MSRLRKASCIIAGIIIGTLVGATSIGGGVVLITVLIVFFGLSPATTVGTSITISVICTMLGSAVYLLNQNIDFPVLLPMFLGALPGTLLGSKLTTKVPQRVLKVFLMMAVAGGIISFFWGASN